MFLGYSAELFAKMPLKMNIVCFFNEIFEAFAQNIDGNGQQQPTTNETLSDERFQRQMQCYNICSAIAFHLFSF